MIISESITERFWSKVDIGQPDACWPWTAYIDPTTGYGHFGTSAPEVVGAHRYAYATEHGDPGPLHVRHSCDNRPCCNPGHLLVGTHQQNMDDMVERDRHVGNRSVTEADVVEMRTERAAGIDPKHLAIRYGLHEKHVVAICAGRFWPDADGPLTRRAMISDGALRAILADKGSMTQKECATRHGVSKPAVQQIWSGFRRPKETEGAAAGTTRGTTATTEEPLAA